MSKDRQLKVRVEYERVRIGTETPFVETIQALDANGKVLGGGRWVKGNPFKTRGMVESQFQIDARDFHAKFRFIIVTKSRREELQFTAKEIFQN